MRIALPSRFLAVSGLLVLGVVVLGASTPSAQAQFNVLTTVKSLSCTFPVAVAASWQAGEPNVEIKKTAVLSFKYDQIDVSESSARFVGPTSAPEHVVAQMSGANLHFMDIRPSGSLSITTVFAAVSRDQKLKAVYTRTNYLPISLPGFVTQPEVSQRYGECEITS